MPPEFRIEPLDYNCRRRTNVMDIFFTYSPVCVSVFYLRDIYMLKYIDIFFKFSNLVIWTDYQ